jgi:hypothetical protein
MKRDKNTTVNGKLHVVHIPRKIVSWKTECGLEVEKVKCISPGESITGDNRCQTCARLAQRSAKSA